MRSITLLFSYNQLVAPAPMFNAARLLTVLVLSCTLLVSACGGSPNPGSHTGDQAEIPGDSEPELDPAPNGEADNETDGETDGETNGETDDDPNDSTEDPDPDPTSRPQAPAAPARPMLNSPNHCSLEVNWSKPSGAVVNGYEVQYRSAGAGSNWTDWPHSGTGTSTVIRSLAADTTYQVRVAAKNAAGPGPWSPAQSKATLAEETLPIVTIHTVSSPIIEGESAEFYVQVTRPRCTVLEVKVQLIVTEYSTRGIPRTLVNRFDYPSIAVGERQVVYDAYTTGDDSFDEPGPAMEVKAKVQPGTGYEPSQIHGEKIVVDDDNDG